MIKLSSSNFKTKESASHGIKNYNFALDVIRVVGIIGVVIIHTTNSVYERPDFFGGMSWWFAVILNSASRICIPLFIMLSGYLLLVKNEKYSITVQRVLNRLLIPLVFWTILNYILSNPDSPGYVLTLPFYLRFFSGNVYYFYFLIILSGLYLVSPLFINFFNNASLKSQKYLTYIFLAAGVIETAEEYLIKNCTVENSFTKWVPYTGLFLMGYLIGSGKIKVKNKLTLKLLYLAGLGATIFFNYHYYSEGSIKVLRTVPGSCLSHYSDHYLAINVVLMAVTGFALLFNISYTRIKNIFWERAIFTIARASFGIYLIHLFIVTVWDKVLFWTVDASHFPLWVYVLQKFFGVFLISFIVVYIMRRMPILKSLIGE